MLIPHTAILRPFYTQQLTVVLCMPVTLLLFSGAPDARLNAYTGPAVLTFPPKHECPTAWNDSNKAK